MNLQARSTWRALCQNQHRSANTEKLLHHLGFSCKNAGYENVCLRLFVRGWPTWTLPNKMIASTHVLGTGVAHGYSRVVYRRDLSQFQTHIRTCSSQSEPRQLRITTKVPIKLKITVLFTEKKGVWYRSFLESWSTSSEAGLPELLKFNPPVCQTYDCK